MTPHDQIVLISLACFFVGAALITFTRSWVQNRAWARRDLQAIRQKYQLASEKARHLVIQLPTAETIAFEQLLVQEGQWSRQKSRIASIDLPSLPDCVLPSGTFSWPRYSYEASWVPGDLCILLKKLEGAEYRVSSYQKDLRKVLSKVQSLTAVTPSKGNTLAAFTISDFQVISDMLREALTEYLDALEKANAHAGF